MAEPREDRFHEREDAAIKVIDHEGRAGVTRGIHREAGEGAGRLATLALFAVPAVLVLGLLFVLVSLRDGLEVAMVSAARLLPVGYAFGAGMVASVNPCGFLLLPSYVSYQLGIEDPGFNELSTTKRILKALLLGFLATAGFVLVFAAIGAVIVVGGEWLMGFFPYASIAIGAVMTVLGLWLLLTHRTIGIRAASRVSIRPKRTLRGGFLFGVAYAISSLGCTLPVFLVVVGSALAAGGFLVSFGQFISYALGMGVICVAVMVGTVLLRGAIAKRLASAIPHVHRMSSLFLVGSGLYLIFYWVFYSGLLF